MASRGGLPRLPRPGRGFATDLLEGGLEAALAKGLQFTEAQIIARIDEFAGLLEKGEIVQGLR
jgi:hypothetical protein